MTDEFTKSLKRAMIVAGCALALSGCVRATMTTEMVRRNEDGNQVKGSEKASSCTERRSMVVYAPFPVRMTREVPCRKK